MNYNEIYVLNPDYIMLNDVDRILFYSRNEVSGHSSSGRVCFLHPQQAIVFSFFTYNRTLYENILLISVYFKLSFEDAEKMISPFLENDNELVLHCQNVKIKIPKNILILFSKCSQTNPFRQLSCEQMKCENVNLTSRRIRTLPLLLTLMLTNSCVTKCVYCYADTQTKVKSFLSTDRLLNIIEEASSIGVKNINLAGGEIFLLKDWGVILKKLIEKGFSPDIISTKYPINESIIHELKCSKYRNRLQISLDSLNRNVLTAMLDVKRDYVDKVKEGLFLLEKNQIPFQITTVLTKYNTDALLIMEIFDFISSFKMLQSWELRPVSASLYRRDNFDDIKAKKEDIESLFDLLKRRIVSISPFNIRLITETIDKEYYKESRGSRFFKGAKCSALNTHMFVLPDGKVTICEQLYWNPRFLIGDLTSQSIKDIWTSDRAIFLTNVNRLMIQTKSSCKNCDILCDCFSNSRCWADIIKSYGDQCWDFPDPRCSYAPSMITSLEY